MNVADEGAPERFTGAFVSANAFSLIGHAPAVGRGFDASDDRPGAAPVVILSDALWRTRYKGDRAVIGRTIRVNGVPSAVIGVMPEGFAFPARSRLWQPLSQVSADTRQQRNARALQGLGRLTPGATPAQAAEDLGRIAAALATAYPATNRAVQPRVALFRDATMGGRLRTTFPILMTMVAFVLLMACANVANLLLARAAYRTREISVRLAVGASRMQIVRQLLVESVLLAGIAGAVGLGLSAAAVEVFQDAFVAGGGLPYWVNFTMDWRVFTFLALTCLGTGIVFGLVPALDASRSGISGRLVEAGTGNSGAMRQRRWGTQARGRAAGVDAHAPRRRRIDDAQHHRPARHRSRRAHGRTRADAAVAGRSGLRVARRSRPLLSAVGGPDWRTRQTCAPRSRATRHSRARFCVGCRSMAGP